MRAKNDENKTGQYLPVHSSQFPDPWVRNLDSDMVLNYAEFRKIFFPIQSHIWMPSLKKNVMGNSGSSFCTFWIWILSLIDLKQYIQALRKGQEWGANGLFLIVFLIFLIDLHHCFLIVFLIFLIFLIELYQITLYQLLIIIVDCIWPFSWFRCGGPHP